MCYNREYENEHVSIFNSHNIFIQIKCSNRNLLLLAFPKIKKDPQAYLEPYQTSMNIFFRENS